MADPVQGSAATYPDHVGPFDPADPVKEAEEAAYLALCTCDDTYGDNPWCPVCTYEEQWP